ncbi:MAG: hypothetical protein QGI60_00010 [archaeon]|jgi:hypothetical protein|nr:hypothetical protein [archaeon]
MKILDLFRESFSMLAKQPKLFLPKLIVAALYGAGMLFIAAILLETIVPLLSQEMNAKIARKLVLQLPLVVGFFFYTIAVFAVDVLVNAMYPVMVKDFKAGKAISFKIALKSAVKKFKVVFPTMLVIDVAVAIPFSLISVMFILTQNTLGLVFSFVVFLAVIFAMMVLFYVVYPISVLKENNFISALIGSIKMGRKNAKQLSIPSLIPFTLSIVSFALTFDPAFLLAFIALRFLMALVATYHMVLNPNIYLALEGNR